MRTKRLLPLAALLLAAQPLAQTEIREWGLTANERGAYLVHSDRPPGSDRHVLFQFECLLLPGDGLRWPPVRHAATLTVREGRYMRSGHHLMRVREFTNEQARRFFDRVLRAAIDPDRGSVRLEADDRALAITLPTDGFAGLAPQFVEACDAL